MRHKFPWRVFWQFFFSQWILFNIIFFVLYFSFIPFIKSQAEVRIHIEWILCFVFVSAFGAILNAYRFSRPIQKALVKALRLSQKKKLDLDYAETSDDLFDEEVGEYSELEHAINRIGKKLKKKKDQLQREREENQAFMASVQEGLMSVSTAEKVLFFNSRFASQFIHSSLVQKEDLSLSDVFRQPEIYLAFRQVLQTGQYQRITCKMNTLIDNQARFFSISLTALRRNKNQEVYGAIGVFHDISDIKLAEQIRIDFVGNASHELRTPLTSIKGYVETLREDIKVNRYDSAPKFLDIVSRNVNRLIELVNDLLSLSQLESYSELKLETMDPLQVSDQIVSEMALIASEKKQVIRVIGEAPAFKADIRKVEQVLRNLISNAIKYIPEGKSIQIRWEKPNTEQVLLRVIDDGPGIPEEHHARLFERFYRIDRGRTRDMGGTGLGLAIVKHIMQSHGGTIQVKSKLGVGSEFICTFPVKS